MTDLKKRNGLRNIRMKFLFYTAISFLILVFATSDLYSQKDSSDSGMSFDLGITRGNNINILPFFRRFMSKEKKEIDVLFPFYSYKRNYINETKRSYLFPVYWSDSTSLTRDLRLFTLYYPSLVHISNKKANDLHSFIFLDLAPEINLLEYTRSDNGNYLQNNILFLLWYYNNKVNRKSHLVFFPLYWSFHNKDKYFNTLVPLYFSGTYNQGNGKFLGVSPLFWHLKEDDKTKNVLFPLWWNMRSGSGENMVRANTLFPVYWSYRDNKQNTKILFPLLWSNKTCQFSSITFLPLFWRKVANDGSYSRLVVTPLFWQNKYPDRTERNLFPVWWYKKTGSGENTVLSNIFFPVYWSHKDYEKNYKVLFPLLWSKTTNKYNSFTFFPLFSRKVANDHSFSRMVITPLYWQNKSPDKTDRTLFPVWWYRKTGNGENTVILNTVFPVYWSQKDHEKNYKVLFPLLWSKTTNKYNSFTFFPLFSRKVANDQSFSSLVITPLYWQNKSPDKTDRTLFPVWWYRKTGIGENTVTSNTVFPVYWSHKAKDKEYKVLFPFLWKLSDPGHTFSYLFPFFSKGVSSDRNYIRTTITPLFWQTKDHGSVSNVLFPIWWYNKTAPGEDFKYSNVLFPVFWQFRDNLSESEVIFPFMWIYKGPDRYYKTFFPLFSAGGTTDSSRRHLMLTPLFWNFKNRDQNFKMLLPLYYDYKDNSRSRKIFFPVFLAIKDSTYSSLTVGPFYSSAHSADNRSGYKMITPLFWHFTKPGSVRNILFPLWWYSKKGTGDDIVSSNVVFPLYWSFKDINSENKVFFPLLWNINNKQYRSFTVFPLYSSGKSPDGNTGHLQITPLFWHFRNNDDHSNILFPILWNFKKSYSDDTLTSTVVFPLYWSFKDIRSDNKVFFPLIWSLKNQQYRSFTVFPLFSSGKKPGGNVNHLQITPLFWHFRNNDDHSNILFPILWDFKKSFSNDTLWSTVVFPLYWSFKNTSSDNKVFFPLIWSMKDQQYRSFTVFPLFSTGKSPDGKINHLQISPLFWHFKNNDDHGNILFPVLWDFKHSFSDDTLRSTVVFPLYLSFKNVNSDNKVFFPLVWNMKNKQYHSLTVFPLFSSGKSPDGNKSHLQITPLFWQFKNNDDRINILFPVLWDFKKSFENDTLRSTVAFPLYWSFKNNNSYNRVIFPLVWSLKNPNYNSLTFFPVVSSGKSPDGSKSHLAFTPLFWHFRDNDDISNVLFPVLWNFKKVSGGDTTISTVAFPLYWSFKNNNSDNKVLFPLVWNLSNDKYRSFTVIPLFSSGKSPDGNTSHLAVTPLFWHFKDKDDISNILFPVVWGFKNRNYNSITVLPLFSAGHSTDNNKRHLVVTPLFWHIKLPQGKTNVLFPLWVYSENSYGGFRCTSNVVFPIFWSYKDELSRNTVVIPLIWTKKNANFSSFTFFPLFFSKSSADKQKKQLMLTPLFWHEKDGNDSRNMLFPLFWNSKKGTGDNMQTSNVVFPVFWWYKNYKHDNIILFPVVWWLKNQRYSSFTVFPLVSAGHSPDNKIKHFVLTPLLWSIRNNGTQRLTFFPLLSYSGDTAGKADIRLLYLLFNYHKEPGVFTTGFLSPLCHYERRPGYRYFRFAPVFWYKNSPNDKFFSIQPFFYHGKDSVSENFNIFWQLYNHKNIFNNKRSDNFLWKFVYNDRYTNGDHEFRVLYFLYSNMKKEGRTEHSVFPLYYSSSDTIGNKSLFAGFYFYHSFKRKIEGTNEFYREDDIFWFIRFRSNYRQLKAKGLDEKSIRQ